MRWVNGKNPMQYGFDFGLWTRNWFVSWYDRDSTSR